MSGSRAIYGLSRGRDFFFSIRSLSIQGSALGSKAFSVKEKQVPCLFGGWERRELHFWIMKEHEHLDPAARPCKEDGCLGGGQGLKPPVGGSCAENQEVSRHGDLWAGPGELTASAPSVFVPAKSLEGKKT